MPKLKNTGVTSMNQQSMSLQRTPDGLGWFAKAATMTDLMTEVTQACLEEDHPDIKNRGDHIFLNARLLTDSCSLSLDIDSQLWYPRGRWTKVIKEYLRRSKIERFIHQAQEIYQKRARTGTSLSFTFEEPRQEGARKWWGGCLMNLVFQSTKKKPILTLNSRAAFWSGTSFIDLALAHRIAKRIAPDGHTDMQFQWVINSMECFYIRMMPFVLSTPTLKRQVITRMKERAGTDEKAIDLLDHMAKLYADMKRQLKQYGPQEMVKREKFGLLKQTKLKWLATQGIKAGRGGKVKPVPMEYLDLDKCPF